eukprot:2884981-Rhodomonas_salina.1
MEGWLQQTRKELAEADSRAVHLKQELEMREEVAEGWQTHTQQLLESRSRDIQNKEDELKARKAVSDALRKELSQSREQMRALETEVEDLYSALELSRKETKEWKEALYTCKEQLE